jgi:hypothetical protein
VRNWGDQGFCGDNQQNLHTPENRIRFRIPNGLGLLSDNVWVGARHADSFDEMDLTIQPWGNDILLNFRLLPPNKQSWFVGDLTFSTREQVVARREEEEYIPFPDLEAQLDKLPPDARMELQRQLQNLTPRRKSYRTKLTVIDQQAQVDREVYKAPVIVRDVTDPTARFNREKRVGFIKKFLAEHGIK